MDITTLSEIELKALAYEQMKTINQAQQNLQLIEQELANRQPKTKPIPASAKK